MIATLSGADFSADETAGEDTIEFDIIRFPRAFADVRDSPLYDGTVTRVTVNSHSELNGSIEALPAAVERRFQSYLCSNTWVRDHFELSTELFGAASHAVQSLDVIRFRFIKTMPIIRRLENDHPALDLQYGVSRLAS